MDKLQLTEQDLVQFSTWKVASWHAVHLWCYQAKLKLKNTAQTTSRFSADIYCARRPHGYRK